MFSRPHILSMGGAALIIIITSVNPVHYAQVCYFNNVWLMFLVF
jgi:hypothetical protein